MPEGADREMALRAGAEVVCSPERIALDAAGRPLLVLPAAWSALPLGVFTLPAGEERGPTYAPHPMLVMVLRGRGRRWYRHGAHTLELTTERHQIDLLGSQYERDAARWEGQKGLTVGVHLQPDIVARLTHEQAFDIATRQELFDSRLSWLVRELRDEAQRGAPGGALFGEGLSIALIGWLREHYGRRPAVRMRSAVLTPAQRQRVHDYVEACLGEELSVARLAQEAALSPERFAHLFKATFGCTPHRWVQQRRVEEAIRLLKTTGRSIADIAAALGFASQSHFTQVFREITGTTPARMRLT